MARVDYPCVLGYPGSSRFFAELGATYPRVDTLRYRVKKQVTSYRVPKNMSRILTRILPLKTSTPTTFEAVGIGVTLTEISWNDSRKHNLILHFVLHSQRIQVRECRSSEFCWGNQISIQRLTWLCRKGWRNVRSTLLWRGSWKPRSVVSTDDTVRWDYHISSVAYYEVYVPRWQWEGVLTKGERKINNGCRRKRGNDKWYFSWFSVH